MALAIAFLTSIKPAEAENAADVLNEFGLLGTWSADCAPGPTKNEGYTIYKVFSVGNPKVAHMFHYPPRHIPEGQNEGIYFADEGEIKAAIRIDADKIEIVQVLTRLAVKENGVMVPKPLGPIVDQTIQKIGEKIRIIDSHSIDGQSVFVKNGFQYSSLDGGIKWAKTEYQTPLREKCLN